MLDFDEVPVRLVLLAPLQGVTYVLKNDRGTCQGHRMASGITDDVKPEKDRTMTSVMRTRCVRELKAFNRLTKTVTKTEKG